MATQQRTIDYLIEQATGAGAVSAKPMFGEYGVYVDGKMIGSVCDDQLFVKPTVSGRVHADPVSDALPSSPPNMGSSRTITPAWHFMRGRYLWCPGHSPSAQTAADACLGGGGRCPLVETEDGVAFDAQTFGDLVEYSTEMPY